MITDLIQMSEENIGRTEKVAEKVALLHRDTSENLLMAKILLESGGLDSHKAFAEKIFKGDFVHKTDQTAEDLSNSPWEYVIVLPNPDFHKTPDELNLPMTEGQAERVFKDCFKAKKTGNVPIDSFKHKQEFMAFMNVFKTLPDFELGKQVKFGGRSKVENGTVYDYHTKTQDFLSLIRNVLMFKLVGGLGLKVKQVISNTGEFIYLIIYADEADLEIEAERTRYSKEMEIALTDIQSLFPCDKSLRPLQLLKHSDPEIKELFKSVHPFIEKALTLCKKVANFDFKYEPSGVTEGQWTAYKIYLTLLKDGIAKIESSINSNKNQMFLFQRLIRESLEKVNFGQKKEDKLMNLWDQLGIEKPISPFSEFQRSEIDSEIYSLWRTYEVDNSGKRSMFSLMERIRLLYSYMNTQINLQALHKNKLILGHFPLQNDWLLKGKSTSNELGGVTEDRLLKNILIDIRSKSSNPDLPLMQCWTSSIINQKIPISKIKNYFGEKIAFYFEFLRYFQISLLLPSIIGLVVFIVQKSLHENSLPVLILNIIYSILMTIWAIVFLEIWKRKESAMAIQWGQTKYEQIEVPRPQFFGKERRSPITDDMDEIFFSRLKRCKFICFGILITIIIISMVLGIVAGLLIFRYTYSNKFTVNGVDYTVVISSILNAIQIQFFNYVYSKLVIKLTELENHKTQVQYEDSLIVKTFIFQFVNSFNSLCYIAFIKTNVEGCIDDSNSEPKKGASCLNELNTQLVTIFVISYLKNLMELGVPYIRYYIRKYRKSKAKVTDESAQKDFRGKIEAQFFLDTYLTPENDGTINDYLELAIQFGYLTLFAIAFPLSTLLAFIGLWLEMLTDKIKVLKLVRRPIPMALKDIGNWWYIFSAISILAIFSNTALFCFTSRTFSNWVDGSDYEYLIFAIIVIVLLIFRNQLQTLIPDVAEKYQIIMARHEYILEKMLRGAVKEDILEDVETYDGVFYYAQVASKDLT